MSGKRRWTGLGAAGVLGLAVVACQTSPLEVVRDELNLPSVRDGKFEFKLLTWNGNSGKLRVENIGDRSWVYDGDDQKAVDAGSRRLECEGESKKIKPGERFVDSLTCLSSGEPVIKLEVKDFVLSLGTDLPLAPTAPLSPGSTGSESDGPVDVLERMRASEEPTVPPFPTSNAPSASSSLDQYDPNYGTGFNQRFLDDIRAAGLASGDDRAVIKMGWGVCDLYDKESTGVLPPGGGFLAALNAFEEAGTTRSEARTIIRLSVTGICPEYVDLLN